MLPVIASRIGKIDIRRLVLAGKRKMLDRYLTYGFERGLYNVQQGWKGTGFIDGYLLFNMAGYSARTHACLACKDVWSNQQMTNNEMRITLIGDVI